MELDMEDQGAAPDETPTLAATAKAQGWDERWASWDAQNIRSYLQSHATSEQKQQQLARVVSRESLLGLVSEWGVSYITKERWVQMAGGFGGVRRRAIDVWGEAERGNLRSVRLYIEQGEDLERRKDRRRTALHCAAFAGHEDVVSALLEAGASVHARDMSRETPLHLAARQGAAAAATALVGGGADKQAEDQDGNKPGDHFDAGVDEQARAAVLAALGHTGNKKSPRGARAPQPAGAAAAGGGGCRCVLA